MTDLEPILRIGLHNRVRLGRFWDKLELPGSYWRLYWMPEEGASLSGRDGKLHPLKPDCIYLLSPNCNLTGHCAGTPVQYYLHFELAGMAGNPEIPLHEIAVNDVCKSLLDGWRVCFIVIYHNCGPNVSLMTESLYANGAAAYHFGDAIDLADVLAKMPCDRPVMGNISPAGEFLGGTPESMTAAVRSLLDACGGYPNFVLSSGCDIPPAAKWENVDAFFAAAEGSV